MWDLDILHNIKYEPPKKIYSPKEKVFFYLSDLPQSVQSYPYYNGKLIHGMRLQDTGVWWYVTSNREWIVTVPDDILYQVGVKDKPWFTPDYKQPEPLGYTPMDYAYSQPTEPSIYSTHPNYESYHPLLTEENTLKIIDKFMQTYHNAPLTTHHFPAYKTTDDKGIHITYQSLDKYGSSSDFIYQFVPWDFVKTVIPGISSGTPTSIYTPTTTTPSVLDGPQTTTPSGSHNQVITGYD